MTEEEWFAEGDPGKLLRHVVDRLDVRRGRLLALALFQQIPLSLLGPKAVSWATAAERLAEGLDVTLSTPVLRRISRTVQHGLPNTHKHHAAATALVCLMSGTVSPVLAHVALARGALNREAFIDSELVSTVREIVGNPFQAVALQPEWRTSTVIDIARAMYDSRDFSAMSILADALQDAGCDSDDILDHCRDAHQVHVRGCWVVDLVLGKT